jgi:hypothetical protein
MDTVSLDNLEANSEGSLMKFNIVVGDGAVIYREELHDKKLFS